MRFRTIALTGIILLAASGTAAIVLLPILAPSQAENTASRLILFLGPVLTVLIGAARTNERIDKVDEKVNGHLNRVTSAIVDAAAVHPDVAQIAREAGINPLPPAPDGEEGKRWVE